MGKHKKQRNQKRSAKAVSVHRAPSMNNMQQVSNWTLFDVVPILFTEPNVDGSVPSTIQIQAGVNGWDWSII
jgi:hypothetical protein